MDPPGDKPSFNKMHAYVFLSWSQGRYPSRWRMVQVTPVFKKDDEIDKRNCRPVTVLPCLNSSIFERLLSI